MGNSRRHLTEFPLARHLVAVTAQISVCTMHFGTASTSVHNALRDRTQGCAQCASLGGHKLRAGKELKTPSTQAGGFGHPTSRPNTHTQQERSLPAARPRSATAPGTVPLPGAAHPTGPFAAHPWQLIALQGPACAAPPQSRPEQHPRTFLPRTSTPCTRIRHSAPRGLTIRNVRRSIAAGVSLLRWSTEHPPGGPNSAGRVKTWARIGAAAAHTRSSVQEYSPGSRFPDWSCGPSACSAHSRCGSSTTVPVFRGLGCRSSDGCVFVFEPVVTIGIRTQNL